MRFHASGHNGRVTSFIAALLAIAPVLHGCAGGAGVAILSSGAGSVAGTGIERTFTGASVRTFTATEAEVESAVRHTIGKMGFRILGDGKSEKPGTIEAESSAREVEAVIERVAGNATRLTVTVDSGSILSRDSATATEIILQTSAALAGAAGQARTP